MTGYRRVEPSFCRGCGAPWTSGADACPQCGEVVWRPPVVRDDPHAIARLLGVVVAALAVVAVRWITLLQLEDGTSEVLQSALLWPLLTGLLAVATVRLWYPGPLRPRVLDGGSARAWAVAVGLGVALPCVAYVGLGQARLDEIGWGRGLPAGADLWWIAMPFAALVVEEILLRGIFTAGVAGVSGERQAIAASVVISLLLIPDVVSLALVVAAGVMRGVTRTVVPGIAMRCIAVGVWLAYAAIA
jgi:membrane protease YdiL (CAAX protease family)